jgi:RNA polymerase sigma factor (TIGR02999 family)
MSSDEGSRPGEVTRLLVAWREGDPSAPGRLFSLLYEQLRALARAEVFRSGGPQTLGATALVHEAYLKLVGSSPLEVVDRGHFFALAAPAMRQILVDRARRRASRKRGGDAVRTDAETAAAVLDGRADELIALDEALGRLEAVDERLGRLVELRFFGGLSVDEAADALETSPRTVKRDWQKARAFLHRELEQVGRWSPS